MKKKCTAILLAAGQGRRMHSSVQKQYLLLGDKPVIYYSLKTFQDSFMDDIILVTGNGDEAYCRKEIVDRYHFTKVKEIVAGGRERYDSVYNALQVIKKKDMQIPDEDGFVFIHDGARPFLTEEILRRTLEAVTTDHACVAGMPVKDTIKVVGEKGYALQTPDRNSLWQVQTPQVFDSRLIIEAYERLMQEKDSLAAKGIRITDDAMVVETLIGHSVRLVQGSYENIKITTPEDLVTAEAFLSRG